MNLWFVAFSWDHVIIKPKPIKYGLFSESFNLRVRKFNHLMQKYVNTWLMYMSEHQYDIVQFIIYCDIIIINYYQ